MNYLFKIMWVQSCVSQNTFLVFFVFRVCQADVHSPSRKATDFLMRDWEMPVFVPVSVLACVSVSAYLHGA